MGKNVKAAVEQAQEVGQEGEAWVGDMPTVSQSRELDLNHEFNELTTSMFTTVDATTDEGEMTLLSMMSDPDERLKDHVNEFITIQELYAEVVKLPNERTGIIEDCPRIIIMADDGTTYGCTSFGIMSMLKRVMYIRARRGQSIRGFKAQIKLTQTQKGNSVLTLKPAK